jgi:arsenite oxidase small subunit
MMHKYLLNRMILHNTKKKTNNFVHSGLTMSNDTISGGERPCESRRHFLLAGATTFVLAGLPGVSGAVNMLVKEHSRQKIGKLSQLKENQPIDFQYPSHSPTSTFVLVKLGEAAGGGVGKDQDIVAFSNLCTHMGGPLNGSYMSKHKALGPCPLHLTTFDLTRHGMVIAGHATESLPQGRLEIDGDDIYVSGIMGILYGHQTNPLAVTEL